MLSIIRNRYFQRIFLCYFLVILCLLSSFGGYLLASGQRREAEIQRANLENEARILAQVMDEKFNTLSDTCVRPPGDTQIEKVSSSSEIIHSSLDIFDRRSICEMLRHYMYMSGMVSSMALLMPQKHEAIDAYSFWDSEERYFQSIGVSQAGFKDELYAAVAESYGSLVLLPLENSRDVAVGRCIDAFSAPRQVFFFRISQTYFSGMLRSHLRSGDYSVELLREGETLLRAGWSDANLPQVVVDSALFGWSYRIALPVAESAPFPMWATLLLAFVLLVLALCAGLLISYFTYQPVMQMLARLGVLHSAGDEFSAVKRRFEEIRQSEIEMEGLTSQYYNSARNNLLLSLLHGAFARRLTNDAMALFGLPFEQSDGKLYVAVVVTDEGERPEEETARDLLTQNYLVLSRIPAVKWRRARGRADSDSLLRRFRARRRGEAAFAAGASAEGLLPGFLCGYECFSGLPHHGLMGISKSYQEALEERTDGETGCQAGYYFPLDWEIQLIEPQLRAGNAQGAGTDSAGAEPGKPRAVAERVGASAADVHAGGDSPARGAGNQRRAQGLFVAAGRGGGSGGSAGRVGGHGPPGAGALSRRRGNRRRAAHGRAHPAVSARAFPGREPFPEGHRPTNSASPVRTCPGCSSEPPARTSSTICRSCASSRPEAPSTRARPT